MAFTIFPVTNVRLGVKLSGSLLTKLGICALRFGDLTEIYLMERGADGLLLDDWKSNPRSAILSSNFTYIRLSLLLTRS